MNYFDGQAESISLSDEALFGDEAAAEERQEIARPQGEDAAEQSPEPNRTSGETAAENPAAPEQSGQAVEQAAEQTAEEPAGVNPELARLQSQYREAHATITRTAQALAEEKRARAEAEAKLQRLQSVPADPEQREVRLQKLLNDPSALIEEAAAPLIDQRLAEALRPFREQIQQQEETRLFGNALQDTMAIFPGLSNREQQTALIERMVERSIAGGDPNAWRHNPGDYLKLAALELLGVPGRIDQAAIDAAVKAKEQQITADLASRNGAKAGLAINQHNNQAALPAKSEEQTIIEGIFSAGSGGYFR